MQTYYHINFRTTSNDVLLDTLDYLSQMLSKQSDVQWCKIDTPVKREYKEALMEVRKRLKKKSQPH